MSKNGKNSKELKNNQSGSFWKKYNMKWVITVSIWTFILTILFSVVAEIVLLSVTITLSFIILAVIIFIGVFSDVIGIAVTVASDKPFHAMASDKVAGAKYAIILLKNASTVSNFCNDVIGDICGIVSGFAGASIIIQISLLGSFLGNKAILTIAVTAIIASLTVGGKAIGKSIAINQSHIIVFNTARFLNFLNMKLGLGILEERSKK